MLKQSSTHGLACAQNGSSLHILMTSRYECCEALDMKFRYGCQKPTFVVTYKEDNKNARHVKAYEVPLENGPNIEQREIWALNNIDNGAYLLLQVSPPLCGVLNIGENVIVYCCNGSAVNVTYPIEHGLQHMIKLMLIDICLGIITGSSSTSNHSWKGETYSALSRVTGVRINYLGETSIASTISYLCDPFIYIGSSDGDSQLVKFSLQSAEIYPIEGFTSLSLAEASIEGFNSDVQTLFCHQAVYDQLVLVTPNSVRLVNSVSKHMKTEWFAPGPLTVATAKATQILLATTVGGHQLLVCLTIGNGVLKEMASIKLGGDVSCLDINPITAKANSSIFAAVGMWEDNSVNIYALPKLDFIGKENLDGVDSLPHSILMCSLDGRSYLLCGLNDGHLTHFELNMSTGSCHLWHCEWCYRGHCLTSSEAA
ncbi:DNA damage-binding protein 1 [Capsicum chinense]|nr:DNA damage-binding protein 1 [Capsicum chinense]